MGVRRGLLVLPLVQACSGLRAPRREGSATETGSMGGASDAALASADTATVEVPLTLPSQLYVERDAAIYARSPGVVESIMVDLGSRVSAGQSLARLESADQRITLLQAEE